MTTTQYEELTAENLTSHVIQVSTAQVKDERLVELLTSLIQHLHDYVREVQLKPTEWERAIQYLTQVRRHPWVVPCATCADVYMSYLGWP